MRNVSIRSFVSITHNSTGAKSHAADNGMVAGMLDLAYVGVYGLWYEDLGNDYPRKRRAFQIIVITDSSVGPGHVARQRTHEGTDLDVASTIRELCNQLQLPGFEGVETDFPELRQLCLYTCGLGMPYSELEVAVKDLVSNGYHTQAAALAIIHDKTKLAFQALRNGNATTAHRLLSLGLAGFVKGETDDTWDETVKDIAKELHDPYARAILALVGDGDWHDVLEEVSLPLKDRVGVALMYLNDKELTGFIRNATTEAIKHGDIEGIVLTGLTEKGMDLFQRYIQRFDDLQTAVLAMSFTVPRYVADVRFSSWREAYRSSMNSWKLFLNRAQFDSQSTKLSKSWDGRTLNQPVPRQVTLRCNNCDQALDRNKGNVSQAAPPMNGSGVHEERVFGGDKSGTVCPKCGRHMPRCAICMMWVGMPNPHSRGAVAAASAKVDPMGSFISICQSCDHVFHGKHAEEWFHKHEVCPVPGCQCRCASLDSAGH